MASEPKASARSQLGLDWLNFFVADVQTGFGPFVAVYLTTNGWGQGAIGSVLSIGSAVGLATQIPAGALVDWTTRKRLVIAVCLGLIAAGALLIALKPSFLPVALAEIVHGASGGALQTALVAIGLGLVGHRAFHTRVGRNQRYNSLGNALTAGGMGALGQFLSPRAPFFAAAALCLPAMAALWFIRAKDIDYARARSSEGRKEEHAAGWTELLRNRRLVVLAGCLFLFQFADASMLPLASEGLAATGRAGSELITAGFVIVPQIVTALIAGWVAAKADEWGRKRLLLIGFATLPLRAGLFAINIAPWQLVAVQILGGLSAAAVGILVPLVVADVVRRSGRYNVALGATSTIGAVGAAVSTTAVGFVAQGFGNGIAFAVLAAAGGLGLGLLAWALPETSHEAKRDD